MRAILPRFDFRADFAQAEDIGRERATYEDAALLAPEIGVFAVADGMGGHQAGEVAARLAIAEVRAALGSRRAQRAAEAYTTRADLSARRAMFAELRAAVVRANDKVRLDAAAQEQHRGMGTTLDVVWLARDERVVERAAADQHVARLHEDAALGLPDGG